MRSMGMALVFAGVFAGCSRTTISYVASEFVDRAGIEGEPIPLDSNGPNYDKRYDDYFKRIRGMIKSQWVYPCIKHSLKPCEYLYADTVLDPAGENSGEEGGGYGARAHPS